MAASVKFETKTPLTDHFRAVVTNLSSSDCIEWVRANLTANQLHIFRAQCFGWVLDMPNFIFPGTMVHNMLFREVITTGLEREMWFTIHGNVNYINLILYIIVCFYFFFFKMF
jgi:hypothetical protein